MKKSKSYEKLIHRYCLKEPIKLNEAFKENKPTSPWFIHKIAINYCIELILIYNENKLKYRKLIFYKFGKLKQLKNVLSKYKEAT